MGESERVSMKESIEITLNPDGTVKIEAQGYKGNTCEQATAFLEEALGMSKTNRRKKPEYHQTNKTGAQQKIGGR